VVTPLLDWRWTHVYHSVTVSNFSVCLVVFSLQNNLLVIILAAVNSAVTALLCLPAFIYSLLDHAMLRLVFFVPPSVWLCAFCSFSLLTILCGVYRFRSGDSCSLRVFYLHS